MSQPSSEERRKFVFVFTGSRFKAGPWIEKLGSPAPERVVVPSLVQLFFGEKYGWELERSLDLPLSAHVEIKEADGSGKVEK